MNLNNLTQKQFTDLASEKLGTKVSCADLPHKDSQLYESLCVATQHRIQGDNTAAAWAWVIPTINAEKVLKEVANKRREHEQFALRINTIKRMGFEPTDADRTRAEQIATEESVLAQMEIDATMQVAEMLQLAEQITERSIRQRQLDDVQNIKDGLEFELNSGTPEVDGIILRGMFDSLERFHIKRCMAVEQMVREAELAERSVYNTGYVRSNNDIELEVKVRDTVAALLMSLEECFTEIKTSCAGRHWIADADIRYNSASRAQKEKQIIGYKAQSARDKAEASIAEAQALQEKIKAAADIEANVSKTAARYI